MRLSSLVTTALILAAPGPASGQTGDFNACIDTTGDDAQPDFTEAQGDRSAVLVIPPNPPAKAKLRLNTFQEELDPELIRLPFEQDLEALIVDDRAGDGASHTLGWFYYDELITRQYVNANNTPNNTNDDTLIDADGSGIPDFHEDLFNLNPARAYIGVNPRCDKRFTHVRPDGTSIQLREPELLTATCNEPGTYADWGGPRRWPEEDNRYPPKPLDTAVVGRGLIWYDWAANVDRTLDIPGGAPMTRVDSWFSDQGLFPHIPNLLEPQDPRNGNKGMGHLALLATDDDDNRCPQSGEAECLQPRMAWSTDGTTQIGPIWDKGGGYNGIPDYKASAFDDRGRLIPGKNWNAAPNEEDRRVKIGRVQGQREIVFFLVTYVRQVFGWMNDTQSTDACFMTYALPPPSGRMQCDLWAHGDINVFFSKTFLNLDLHQTAGEDVVTKNLRTNWLDQGAYDRLQMPEYGRVFFEPTQNKTVRAINQRAAHTIVGAPANNPNVWILGWEDQNSGGNRTYNDIVILINKQNNGVYKSEVVSDIDLADARDYTITSVTLSVDDHPFFDPQGNSGACTPNIEQPNGTIHRPRPKISYQVALDCKVCVSNCNSSDPQNPPVFGRKPTEPDWIDVPFNHPTEPPGERNQTVSIDDLLERGYTGTQLCWRAIMESPGEGCQPTIANVNISYKAQKSGKYERATRIRVANTELFGVAEVPGRQWVETPGLQPSTRLLNGRPDMSPRGHVYLKKLYEPENQNVLLPDSDLANPPLWDAGEVQRLAIRNGDPNARKLFTRRNGARTELKNLTGSDSPVFPTTGTGTFCPNAASARYDLNIDGECNAADRTTLIHWLYGWEQLDPANPNNPALSSKRTWPMGAIGLSAPALVAEPTDPAWLLNPYVTEDEKSYYRDRFKKDPLIEHRKSVAFIGTNQGFLHALDVGAWRFGDDSCTPANDYSGHFEPVSTNPCSTTRRYGTGEELFAYLPGKMLGNYVESYLRTSLDDKPAAKLDSPPTFANVDLGQNANPDNAGTHDYNVRKGYTPDPATAWRLNNDPTQNIGAKTVLASAAGPDQSVFFALDVTNPNHANYPWPMWEFDIANELYHAFDNSGVACTSRSTHYDCLTIKEIFDTYMALGQAPVRADTRGSRHNPLLLRMDFGSQGGKKWVAAFATDFTPRENSSGVSDAAGTIYLIDVKTGQPVMTNSGSGLKQRLTGVVTLGTDRDRVTGDHGKGIGGAPSAVDVNGDGAYDVLYVPSTSGKVYKVNLRDVDASRAFGKAISSCVIANAQTATYANGQTVEHPSSQRIYSNLLVKTTRTGASATVSIFFGTGNNPDSDVDADDLAGSPRRYHVMAFEDRAPLAADCSGRAQVWVQPLGLGQAVWGGLALRENTVATATAVGTKADACSVSDDKSGEIYLLNGASGEAMPGSGTALGGHSFAPPTVIGQRLRFLDSTGGQGSGKVDGAGALDVPGAATGGRAARSILWDMRSNANIQEVVP
ncbi:pilus assembly protein PilY [Pyxidicoccus fallax]|uniref:Pilus assembly protein PilY n=1 Tax=Pyxidicoccus fallax TaxID=394095 RepID=A0A848LFW0_9BACT|nr:pilus assembly protein PilY [Pyxidicoccus fallax]NMO16053.1 pilus assembly protein PilY [Pyxidicoccus fallax]NPC84350.1 pilus assembly protein PilY [Pyxidicoccus fallax]